MKQWEEKGKRILETVFDGEGAVLQQKLLELDSKGLEAQIEREIRSAAVPEVKSKPYEEAKLKKPCPNCGSSSLERCNQSVSGGDLPVVPIYLCKSCNKRSYHLTGKYLEYLITMNKGLFAQNELAEMGSRHDAFVNELEGYILRIFASKKISRIK